ncbi:MAG TPA: hypothetical protein VNK04_05980 [Gemmataceae bacterium]|nr:hypothetical protein [Gemmataceae bacterium]
MLTEQEIQQALHASRVVPLSVENPHGPLGLEHLAGEVAQLVGSRIFFPDQARVRRPLELNAETWAKLDHLAEAAAKATSRQTSASEVAAAIIEQFLAASRQS